MIFVNLIINLLKKRRYRLNFEILANEWLTKKKIGLKESTCAKYEYMMNKYLIPRLKGMSMRKLQKFDFNELVLDLMDDLSSKSIRDILCILKAILYYANDEYEYNFRIKRITNPKLDTENIAIMSKREKSRLQNYCIKENSLKSLGIIICLNTGLRIGEICALKWENINLEKRTLSVKKTLQRIYDHKNSKTKIIISAPKTKSSMRQIPISTRVYCLLKNIKKDYKDSDYFLTGESSRFIEPRNYQEYLKNIQKKCKIKHYKFHCLRHFFATECISVGMDAKTLSVILGHASVDVTLNRYVHSDFRKQKKFLERL